MEPEPVFRKAAFGDPRTAAQIKAAKRINAVALLGLIILLGSTFFYFIRLNNTKMALEDSKSVVEIQKDSLAQLQARQERLIEELNSYKNNLAIQKRQSDSTLQDLAAKVNANDIKSARSIAREFEAAAPPKSQDARDDRFVNVYLYRAPAAAAKALHDYLAEQHFQILREEITSEMEKWLTPGSTIEYFRESDEALAESMATNLTRLTGSTFAAQYTSSATLADRPNWLNVTLIGKDGVQEIMQMNLRRK